MEIALRDYRPEDFETLWVIDQKCFAPGIAYSRRELSIYIRRKGSFTVVAEASAEQNPASRIVAFILSEAVRNTGHIISIDVLPEARRSGVGSRLIGIAEERLQSNGCRLIVLETAVDNSPALSFYKRHGYHVVGVEPRYYSNGTDALLLEKELATQARNVAGA